MSKRRMFNQDIVESDVFLDMPLSTQALYMHLSMNADDYGFVSPKRIMRMIGANDDDLKVLIMKRFVLSFDAGVVVIKHWQINNTVRKDRSHPTTYNKEFESLTFNEFGAYTELSRLVKIVNNERIEAIEDFQNTLEKRSGSKMPVDKVTTGSSKHDVDDNTTNYHETTGAVNRTPTVGQPNGNQMATEIRLDKIRLDKNRVLNPPAVDRSTTKRDVIPTTEIDELLEYWEQVVGYKPGNELGNRRAIASLYRQHGKDGLKRLVQGVVKAQEDRFAPRISDFVSLKRKQNDLIVWGKQRIGSTKGKSTVIS